MRQFLVLGYETNSTQDTGKVLHIGGDADKALKAVSNPGTGLVRSEMYELAIPMKRKHFDPQCAQKAKAKRGKE